VTSIDWSARNLLDGIAGPLREEQTAYLQAILTSAIHLGQLVTNLLEVSRLEEGDAAIELGPVCLASVTDEAVVGLVPIAAAKDVRFVRRIDRRLAPVLGNHERLVQVLVNLLENAIRYSPSGSPVEITLEHFGSHSQKLTVRDPGPGIRPGEEEAIFERFRQGEPSPHAQPQGFGLGLYVVKAHVEAFSGSVCAANHPQGGAEFVVLLREWPQGEVATA
jgi:signal transduction histidine kinase